MGSAPRPPLDQAQTPLLDALMASAQRQPHAPFYAPGHKRGQGISPRLSQAWGGAVFKADLPELPELDNLFAPEGVIQAAQELAAEAFGAEQTWFLANGSTAGIQAAILATCAPGGTLILPRNAHQSLISALIMTGVQPGFVLPEYDPDWDLAHGVSTTAVAAALEQYPRAQAVMVVSPTYHGVYSDIASLAQLCHARGLPLLVDEAHGAHAHFHPQLPQPALAAGADLAVQSTHKTLGAMTQAAMVHVGCDRIDRQRLQRSLQLTQSTSPSYLLLASLDAARQHMATAGIGLWAKPLALAQRVHQALESTPLKLLSPPPGPRPGFFALDATRLTVDVSAAGWDGFRADDYLHQTLGVTAELPGLRQLTFILSHGNTSADGEQLITALKALLKQPAPPCPLPQPGPLPTPVQALSPRDAFFSPSQSVPRATALGEPSADLICPYPPGIPVLLPGEVITAAAVDYLERVQGAGGYLTGASDPSLVTLRIVESSLKNR